MAKDAAMEVAQMKRRRTNRIGMILPVVFSAAALALVLGHVAAGTPPQADEGTAAHLFQFLIVAQLPLIILFTATADWTRPARSLQVLLVQALAGAGALAALYWSGY
ncbi:MAG TPA: hypothetical protein VEW71_10110 [Allosphingosinicella sp.]|nr:hypothetical protein [Allosphingosinicella sp.]